MSDKSSAYIQFPDSGDCAEKNSQPDDTSVHAHMDTNEEYVICTYEGYVQKRMVQCNEDDLITYKDASSWPDVLQ